MNPTAPAYEEKGFPRLRRSNCTSARCEKATVLVWGMNLSRFYHDEVAAL